MYSRNKWLQMRPRKELPVLSTIPRSGTWFLRYVISFLSHLDRGGRIDDRITGEVAGDPSGVPFNFERFAGGPLFRVRSTMRFEHMFIGHTVCPGFSGFAGDYAWWSKTPFHVPGYDGLHEEPSYENTPVELAPYRYAPISVPALERASLAGRGAAMALVYRNPLAQAASYHRYCISHANPAYSFFNGRPLADVPFDDYLFGGALPSYAKQFISFQAMAARHPGLVRLVAYERLVADPMKVIAQLLNHLSGTSRGDWPNLGDAIHLARREHLKAVEAELGRSLDGTRAGRGSHMWLGHRNEQFDDAIRDEAVRRLQAMGVNTDLFVWSAANDRRTVPPLVLGVAAE